MARVSSDGKLVSAKIGGKVTSAGDSKMVRDGICQSLFHQFLRLAVFLLPALIFLGRESNYVKNLLSTYLERRNECMTCRRFDVRLKKDFQMQQSVTSLMALFSERKRLLFKK
mmetsp:Transcript_60566/g.69107  ORF Transcript_60566/g.69107 Transcript_60566/m.69107 type:complete len:113 (+) Transcript_60566:2291-2629(+)